MSDEFVPQTALVTEISCPLHGRDCPVEIEFPAPARPNYGCYVCGTLPNSHMFFVHHSGMFWNACNEHAAAVRDCCRSVARTFRVPIFYEWTEIDHDPPRPGEIAGVDVTAHHA